LTTKWLPLANRSPAATRTWTTFFSIKLADKKISCTFAKKIAMLIQNFYYYLANQDELVRMYNGKYLVISDKKVVYAAPDNGEAYNKGLELAGKGNFIVQLCTPGTDAYTSRCFTPWVRVTNALSAC
jgi:hypothetical protein